MQGEAATADVEAASSYPEDLDKILMKVATYPKLLIFNVNETTLYGLLGKMEE